jgi:5-hydroxyisourate hydrolase
MAGLTTHVLDTSKGAPAFNLKIELFKINKLEKNLVGTFITNQDGRVDKPLITAENLEEIEYELLFFVGDYLKNVNVNLDKHLFLDKIPIRFNVTNKLEHFHVPLLLSPFGYSTYRGS